MTAWDCEIARVADDLTALVARVESGPVDLDVALTARAAVLDGVTAVLGDLAPRTRHESSAKGGRHVTLHLLERDPLAALGLVLRRRVRPELDRSPSELLDASLPWNAATGAWASAGRHALLAARAWWTAPPWDLPGDYAWEAVGTVTALAEAIAVLDVDLAAHNAGARPEVDRVLAAGAGLRIAARETLNLARAGPAPGPNSAPEPSGRTVTPPEGMRPMARAWGEATISPGLGRLTVMLADVDSLTPQHVRTCARLGRDLAILTVRDGGPNTPRDILGGLARALHFVAHTDRGERAILSASSRALEVQLLDLQQVTRSFLVGGAGTLDRDEAQRVQLRLPALVAALSTTTCEQLDDRRWAVPDRGEGEHLPFALATRPGLHEPGLLQPLNAAASASGALRDRLAAAPGAQSRANPTYVALHRQLRQHEPVVQRPAHPSRPIPTRYAPVARGGPTL